jgi:hypothetical protein
MWRWSRVAGLLDGVFGSDADRNIAVWRSVKIADCFEEVETTAPSFEASVRDSPTNLPCCLPPARLLSCVEPQLVLTSESKLHTQLGSEWHSHCGARSKKIA